MVATSEPAVDAGRFDGASPFHVGEQKVQSLTGARDISEKLGRAWHDKRLSPAASDFFAQQQFLYTASRNSDGSLWASVLAGPVGFLSSPDPTTLLVKPLRQIAGDPAELNEGDYIGTLGIVLETRQRERLNGLVAAKAGGALTCSVQQSFSGCPKYIQARKVELDEAAADQIGKRGSVTSGGEELGSKQRELIERADTLFLATCYFGDLDGGDGVRGTDASHRGGPPGFVHVCDRGTLRFADYVGNYTFTTLGNLILEPKASILFIDFASGDTLQLSGRCSVLWEERDLPGAERTMEFVTQRWVHVEGALPLKAPSAVRWSPYNPLPTCRFSAAVGEERLKQLHNNYVAEDTQFSVRRCLESRVEAEGIMTFEFEGKAGSRVAGATDCAPGQYATFDFGDIEEGQTLNRTWTVSSTREEMEAKGSFTITVKKVGKVSGWLFDNMRPGRTVCLRGVDGDFTTAKVSEFPAAGVLLIAGGIGITPMRVMFHDCRSRGVPVTLIYSVQKLGQAAFLDDLQQASKGRGPSAVVLTLTSGEGDTPAVDSGVRVLKGRLNADMLAEVCPDLRHRIVYQCGPPAMMQSVEAALESLEFPAANLHKEAFFF